MAEQSLPPVLGLLRSQLGYHLRRIMRTPRAVSTGALMPVLLLVLANPQADARARVGGLAALGAGMTAWTTHGIGLVAAREAGELRRWRALPIPRWCFLGARVTASVVAASLGGLATIVVGVIAYHVRPGFPSALAVVGVLVLGSAAWAAPATAITRLATSVESAWPILCLTYLPVVVTSGALSDAPQPAWLRDVSSALPAQPMVDAVRAALGSGAWSIADVATLVAWTVGGLVAAGFMFSWDPAVRRDGTSRSCRAR